MSLSQWGWRHVSPIVSELRQLSLSGFLHRLRTNEALQMSPGATQDVRSLSRYAPDSKFPLSLGHFTSPSGYTRPLRTWTWFIRSLWRFTSFGAPLASPRTLIASRSTMPSSSPTSAFRIVTSSPELRLALSLYILKALNNSFPTSPGTTPEVRSLSCYVPNFKFSLSPACFASSSGYTQPLGTWTLFLGSPWQPALFGTSLAPPSALVASGFTMSSSSPTSIFCLVASPPELHSAQSIYHWKLSIITFQWAHAWPERRTRCPTTCWILMLPSSSCNNQ